MAEEAGLEGFTLRKCFITHVGIERKAPEARAGPDAHFRGIEWALLNRFYRRRRQ